MHWLMLLLAGVFEVSWAYSMKLSEGFSKLAPSVVTIVGYILSAVFLSIALKKLPLGTAYAMWTGFGIIGTTLLGIFIFHESVSIPQIICVVLILSGIVGLKVVA